MPLYPDLQTIKIQPHPELALRWIYERNEIRSVLDVGAGRGGVFDLVHWESCPMDCKYACDIHWMKELPSGWQTKTGVDVCSLTKYFQPKSFDMVQCMETLEHVSDPHRALEELCKVARRLVLITSGDEMHHKGEAQEDAVKLNPHQKYIKQPSVDVMQMMGFDVRVNADDLRQLIAWKYFP